MIPIRVSVAFDINLTRTEKKIAELPNRLRDLRPLMEDGIRPATDAMLRRHWESKGAAFRHKWAGLAPETIRKRLRHGTLSKGILRDSDHLFREIFRAAGAGRVVARSDRITLEVSVKEKKAMLHQRGTLHMPARQVIPEPLPTTFRRLVTRMVREYLRTGNVSR